jgi:hypothetical protein
MTSSEPNAGQEVALPQPAYTPSLLMQGVVTELARRDPKTSRVILLRAIPQRKRAETYSGYAFITLRDPQNTTAIDGKISKGLVERLEWGREHLFSGIVQYDRFNDRITVQFVVGGIEGTGAARQPSKEDLLTRWQAVIGRPKPDPEAALLRERPRIAVVTATTTIAMDDIRAQMRETEAFVEFVVHNVAMTRPEDVAEVMRRAGLDTTLLVLTRGGGTTVHDLDTDEMIQAIAECPVPTVVAVGHATDVLVLNRVACRAFATPTEFGAWLREALLRRQAREVEAARARDIEVGQVLIKQLDALSQENRVLRDAAARTSALEQEREVLRARLRLVLVGATVAAAAAVVLILLLVYLMGR